MTHSPVAPVRSFAIPRGTVPTGDEPDGSRSHPGEHDGSRGQDRRSSRWASPGVETRYLFYSHDSFGLGHLRRTLTLARMLASVEERASVLILTGSSLSSSYKLPPGIDVARLPALTKTDNGGYTPARLRGALAQTLQVRSEIALATARSFQPHVTIVDKTPAGLRGEFLPALETLRAAPGSRLVLGLRDVEDSVAAVRHEWAELDLEHVVSRYYDEILVYGPHPGTDALSLLGRDDLATGSHYVGYVTGPRSTHGPDDLPSEYLLATVGGGSDGFALLHQIARALHEAPLELPTVMVTGPLMADDHAAALESAVAGLDVRLVDFRPDMEALVAGARAVVAMAGYNTVAELLHARARALLVPRVTPREEQLIRARALAAQGLVSMLDPRELEPRLLRAELEQVLTRALPPPFLASDGAGRATSILRALAARAQRERVRRSAILGA